jgi:pilus assembly protein TadC
MISTLLGAAAGAIVIMTAVRLHGDRERLNNLKVVAAKQKTTRSGPIVYVALQLVRVPLLRRYARNERYLHSLGLTALICVPLMFLAPQFVLVIAPVILVRPFLVDRRNEKARRRAILRELPVVAEMLLLCVRSGLNIYKSVEHIVQHSSGPICDELAYVLARVAQGGRIADELEAAAIRLGDDVRQLTNAIVSSERYGAPLSATLERLAQETRRDQERRAEQAGQKLAVQLIFPVAVTSLPAFAALTVPPLVASSIGSLAMHF